MNIFRRKKVAREELMNVELEEFFCPCGRFLGYHAIVEGTIAIKCKRCKGFAVLDNRVDNPSLLMENTAKVETGQGQSVREANRIPVVTGEILKEVPR